MRVCGKDLDDLFAYQTPKIVVLRDYKLGLIRLALVSLIFLYIFVYEILYQGKHLAVKDIDGVFRGTLRHPTVDSCDAFDIGCQANYTSYLRLPYCAESSRPYLSPSGKEHAKRPCQIWDSVESTVPLDEGLLIPTRITRFDQQRSCAPSKENGWICEGVPYVFVDAEGQPQKDEEPHAVYDIYVADIEHFTLEVDHQFRAYGMMQADDFEMHGYLLECPTAGALTQTCAPRRIPCAPEMGADCLEGTPRPGETSFLGLRGGLRPRAHDLRQHPMSLSSTDEQERRRMDLPAGEPVVAAKRGDIFEVGALLRAAKTTLDSDGCSDGDTHRQRGLVLVIHIFYENTPTAWAGLRVLPWRKPPHPWYTYQVSTRTACQYKVVKTFDDPAAVTRSVRNYYGARVVVEQSGALVVFETTQFFITMTAALGLLAVGTTVTEMLMMYAMKRREAYSARKFQRSKDFHPEDDEPQEEAKPASSEEAGLLLIEAINEADGKLTAERVVGLLEVCKKEQQ